jgi:hypothetical protein
MSRFARAAVGCVAIAVLMGSCGDDDDDSQSTADVASTTVSTAGASSAPATAPAPATTAATATAPAAASAPASDDVCADREALRSSVDALVDVDVVAEGTDGVTAAIADVKDNLTALRGSAGDELQPDVQAVQDAVDDLETTVDTGTIGSGGAADAAAAIATLGDAANSLLASLDAVTCDS